MVVLVGVVVCLAVAGAAPSHMDSSTSSTSQPSNIVTTTTTSNISTTTASTTTSGTIRNSITVAGLLRIIGTKEQSGLDTLEWSDSLLDTNTDQWLQLAGMVYKELDRFNAIEPCNWHCNLIDLAFSPGKVEAASSSRSIIVNYFVVFNDVSQENLKNLKSIFDEETRTAGDQHMIGDLVIDPEWSRFFVYENLYVERIDEALYDYDEKLHDDSMSDTYVYDEGLQLYLNMYDEIKNNELINVELSDEQKEEIKDNGY